MIRGTASFNSLAKLLRLSRYVLGHLTYRLFCDSSHIRSLKGSLKNKTVLIVGNGPSLNQTPLEDFSDVFSIGMNKIDLIFDKTNWRPNIVLATNRHVIKQQSDYYSKSVIPTFIPWQQRWFSSSRGNSIKYFDCPGHRDFSLDVEEGCGLGHTVTFTALQFAYYMGAARIILVGVDHSFASTGEKNELVVSDGPDVNHFSKDYFGAGTKWNLPDLEGSENDYLNVRTACELAGIEIFDATIGGQLMIFKKISIERAKQIMEVDKEYDKS